METRSAALNRLLERARQFAVYDRAPILLLGETGTGKSSLARWIHVASPRAAQPFIERSLGAFTESLIASELFGHTRGAFTGAVSSRDGIFESADGGTVFLDELGFLPLALQPFLLQVTDRKVITRLGTTRSRTVDVRLVSATSVDIETEATSGRFLPDLLERLRDLTLRLPPLRERREDIPALAARFIVESWANAPRGPRPPRISPALLDALVAAPWLGNLRALRRAMLQIYLRADGASTLTLEHADELETALSDAGARTLYAHSLEELESLYRANDCRWNRVAQALGVNRTSVHDRYRELREQRASRVSGATEPALPQVSHGD